MPVGSSPQDPSSGYSRAENKLDERVLTIEFTMISVIAGLMLFPLIECATPLVREMRVEYWVYILTQLAIVMFFWTALVAHALTFIGWPIDVGHNLIYLLVFPVVGLEMHFMSEPGTFYPMLVVIALVGLLLPVYDLSVIRKRRAGARGAAGELYAAVQARQVRLVRLSMAGFLMTGVMAGLVAAFPGPFVKRHGHVLLGFGLLAYILSMIRREARQLRRLRNKILAKAAEELGESSPLRRENP